MNMINNKNKKRKTMKMKPMGDQLLLKPIKQETKSASGIILSADSSTFGKAEVINVGEGVRTMTGDIIPMTCKIGDIVIAPIAKLSGKNGNEIELEDETYVLVREMDIAMVSINK